jgi:hypothetical protein
MAARAIKGLERASLWRDRSDGHDFDRGGGDWGIGVGSIGGDGSGSTVGSNVTWWGTLSVRNNASGDIGFIGSR